MTGEVAVWWLRTDQPAPVVAELAGLLDEGERLRAELIAEPVDRARFIVAHAAARQLVATLVGHPPSEVRWRFGLHGKPELASAGTDLQCNLSHSGELAAFAVSRGRPVGIDLQSRQFGLDIGKLAARYYPAEEARFVERSRTELQRAIRFTGLWARKEAGIKAEGGRLMAGLRRPARTGVDGQVLICDPDDPSRRYLVRDLAVAGGYHAAVAVGGTSPFTVARQWWAPPAVPARSVVADSMVVERC